MTSFEQRKYYYTPVAVNGNRELDFLKSSLPLLKMTTATYHRITTSTANRSDLISKIYYDNYDLGWLISIHNDITDPFTEYAVGREIAIPFIDDYYQFFNRYAKELE
jgi:hypothetical protein